MWFKKKKYEYLVSYNFTTAAGYGFGDIIINSDMPIHANFAAVREHIIKISKQNTGTDITGVSILNIYPYGKP